MSRSSLRPIPAPARSTPHPWLLLALTCAVLLLSGCIQDAEMKQFKCNNPNDPNPSSNCDTSAGSAGTGLVAFVLVDNFPGLVILMNTNTTTPVIMTAWTIVNGDAVPVVRYTFPSFTLAAGGYVRIHDGTGTDNTTDLFGATFFWGVSPAENTAILRNDTGTTIAGCQATQPCWP